MLQRLRDLDMNAWTSLLMWLALTCLVVLLLADAASAATACTATDAVPQCPPGGYYACKRVLPFWTWCRCWLR